MASYLLIALEDEGAHAAEPPGAVAALIERRARFVEELRRTGRLVDAGRFRPSREGRRVRLEAGRLRVEDGPFADGGAAVGGFCAVEAPGLEEAVAVAAGWPGLPSDDLEVRPLTNGSHLVPDKEARPGKIFGFLVLGEAPTEDAWVRVMDRIEADTGGRFPADSFLGGGRLHPPTSGRRLATRGERRATLDGPFLESKEVIGGLFFLRLASLEDAVRWAADSRFVVHGALEIRELWRS